MVDRRKIRGYQGGNQVVQCQCGRYHTDGEAKLGEIRYSAQRDGKSVDVGRLYFCPDCELMPGITIDWDADPLAPAYTPDSELPDGWTKQDSEEVGMDSHDSGTSASQTGDEL
jgi:acetone carboxylase gamma subunit